MSIKLLRDYQINAINAIYESWDKGNNNVLLQLSTGGGKTIILSEIVRNHSGYVVEIAHRSELIVQLSLTLARNSIFHDILSSKETVKICVALHMRELNQSYYRANYSVMIAAVDTLIRLKDSRFDRTTLVVFDEAHHVLRDNKWGAAAKLFPRAKQLHLTATPERADGKALGRQADGFVDDLIIGPTGRDLIEAGYLSDYHIVAPASNIDLTQVPISAGGDFSPPKLREAVKKSRIVGDVVDNYIKFAKGKLGITFAASIDCASDIAQAYQQAGISAEIISGNTPPLLRANIMDKFRKRELLQLVNVDILGEGVDVPAIEVVSFARPTRSYSLYCQQFGRALRVIEGKKTAIIIDHVDNVAAHGYPDLPRDWYLSRRKRAKSSSAGVIPLRTCGNVECLSVYERIKKVCPYCGFMPVITERSTPEQVDGDLIELDIAALAQIRKEITRIDSVPRIPLGLDPIAQRAIINRHTERQQNQAELRHLIAIWAGYFKEKGIQDSEIYRRFYFNFGTDILTAQTLSIKESQELINNIKNLLTLKNIHFTVSN